MVHSAIIQQVIGAIFGFQYLVDVLVGIFILIAFFIGISRGIWRSLWRLIFVVLVLVLVNMFAMDAVAQFVDNGFWTLTEMSVTIEIPLIGSQQFTSLGSIIEGIRDYADLAGHLPIASPFRDDAFLAAFSLALARMVGWLIVVLLTMVVSWLVSGLLWLILWGPLLKSVKKKKVKFVGGLLGLVQGYVYALVFAISFSPLTGALAVLENPTEQPYAVGEVIPLAADGLRPENSLVLNILTDSSNPFGLFTGIGSFDHDGTSYNLAQVLIQFVQETEAPAT